MQSSNRSNYRQTMATAKVLVTTVALQLRNHHHLRQQPWCRQWTSKAFWSLFTGTISQRDTPASTSFWPQKGSQHFSREKKKKPGIWSSVSRRPHKLQKQRGHCLLTFRNLEGLSWLPTCKAARLLRRGVHFCVSSGHLLPWILWRQDFVPKASFFLVGGNLAIGHLCLKSI